MTSGDRHGQNRNSNTASAFDLGNSCSRKCSFVFSLSSIFINVVFAIFPHLTTLNVVV